MVSRPIWGRFDQAASGVKGVNSDGFEYMLSVTDEFNLRVLLRHFDEREELLTRLGPFELDPAGDYTDAQVEELINSNVESYRELAESLAPGDYPWASSPEPLPIVHVPAGTPQPRTCESYDLIEWIWANCMDEFDRPARALFEVLTVRSLGIGLLHLLGPLMSKQYDFESNLLLFKTGRYLWIDDGTVYVLNDGPSAHWENVPGWNPQLEWPTDDEVATYVQGESQD